MRAPVDIWKTLKKLVLGMHVLLVMVHGRPNSNYFYYMNGAIRGDANFNIEGIRRALLANTDGGALPETLYAQMDRAGDNLNYTMIGFFGVLVLWGMLGQVFLSCLVVSHTHEDVDQTFSVGARFMYKAMGMLLSVTEFFGAMMDAYRTLSATHTKVQSVLDWKWWLGTTTAAKDRCCINKKGMRGLRTQRIDGVKHGVGAIWIHKVEGRVVLHYKEYSTDELWMPFARGADGEVLKPLKTDEAGIPIFTQNPVGGWGAMCEAELHTVEVQSQGQAGTHSMGDSSDEEQDSSDDEVIGPPQGRGRGGVSSRGRAGVSSRGKGGVSSRGRGGMPSRGRGGMPSRGRGGMDVGQEADKEGADDDDRPHKSPPLNVKGVVEAVKKLAAACRHKGASRTHSLLTHYSCAHSWLLCAPVALVCVLMALVALAHTCGSRCGSCSLLCACSCVLTHAGMKGLASSQQTTLPIGIAGPLRHRPPLPTSQMESIQALSCSLPFTHQQHPPAGRHVSKLSSWVGQIFRRRREVSHRHSSSVSIVNEKP